MPTANLDGHLRQILDAVKGKALPKQKLERAQATRRYLSRDLVTLKEDLDAHLRQADGAHLRAKDGGQAPKHSASLFTELEFTRAARGPRPGARRRGGVRRHRRDWLGRRALDGGSRSVATREIRESTPSCTSMIDVITRRASWGSRSVGSRRVKALYVPHRASVHRGAQIMLDLGRSRSSRCSTPIAA